MATSWQDYQEEAAEFFRSLGMDAEANVSVAGVRTNHNLDVAVLSSHAGFDIFRVIECKQWQSRVSKLHVLGLRSIVADLGADRGILQSETGFQGGAVGAAALTSVKLTSLADLELSTRIDFAKIRITEVSDRAVTCKERYWAIPKARRIEYG